MRLQIRAYEVSMNGIRKTLVVALIVITPFVVQADTYSWANGGRCAQFNVNNRFVQNVDDAYCAEAPGFEYSWTNGGSCGLYSVNKQFMKYVDESNCRNLPGTFYAWTNGGTCSLIGANQQHLKFVDVSYCSGN